MVQGLLVELWVEVTRDDGRLNLRKGRMREVKIG